MICLIRSVRWIVVFACLAALLSVRPAVGQPQPPPRVATPVPGVLRVAHDEKYPPFEFASGGRSDGFDLAVIARAAQALNLTVEFKPMPWAQVEKALIAGEADVTPAMMHNPERLERWVMGRAWGHSSSVVFVQADSKFQEVQDLRGHRVAAPEGDVEVTFLKEQLETDPTTPPNTIAALHLLRDGKVAGVGVNRDVAFYEVASDPTLRGHIRMLEQPLGETPYSVASVRGNEELVARLTQEIEALKANGTFERLHRNWFFRNSPEYERWQANRAAVRTATWVALLILFGGVLIVAAFVRVTRSRRELRQTFHLIQAAVIKIDRRYRITYTNPHATELFGYTEAEFRNANVFDLIIPPKLRVEIEQVIEATFADDGRDERTLSQNENKAKDGRQLWISWANTRLAGPGGEWELLCIGTDITELRRAQEQKELAQEQRREFFQNMTHDFRTPLSVIEGFANKLQRQFPTNGKVRQNLDTIELCSSFLGSLIQDLLDYGHLEAGTYKPKFEDFDLGTCLNDLFNVHNHQSRFLEKELDLICYIKPDVPRRLHGPQQALRRILFNLLGNAVKFTQTGFVSLRVEVAERDQDRMGLRFTVRDTGPGIPPADRARIFERFRTAGTEPTEAQGNGLGLAICQELTTAIGGQIHFEVPDGPGIAFVVVAPFDSLETDAPAPAPALGAERRVWLAARSPLLEELSDLFRTLGYTASGGPALPPPDHGCEWVVIDEVLNLVPPNGERVIRIAPHALQSPADAGQNPTVVYRPLSLVGFARALGQLPDAPPPYPARSVPRAIRPRRILVAEDNKAARQLMVQRLEESGHQVTEARDGEEALCVWNAGKIDVILLDERMPKGNGTVIASQIRDEERTRELPATPIILVSAYGSLHGEGRFEERARLAGVNACLPKEVGWEELIAAIDQAAGESGASEPVGSLRAQSDGDRFDRLSDQDLRKCFRRPEQYAEFAGAFIQDCNRLWAAIRAGLGTRANSAVAESAHELAGMVAVIRAQKATVLVRGIGTAATAGRFDEAERLSDELAPHLDRICDRLASLIKDT